MFGSLEDDQETEQVRYVWGRLAKDGGKILFWLPREEKFRELEDEDLVADIEYSRKYWSEESGSGERSDAPSRLRSYGG